jgi:hypothetical protein
MSTIFTHRTGIIVAAADQASANADAAAMSGNAADLETFTVPLFAAGSSAPSYYVCSGVFDDAHRQQITALEAKYPTARVVDYSLDDPEPNALEQAMAALGVSLTVPGGA